MEQRRTSSRALVLLSGGIDSAAVAHFLKRNHSVEGLFVDYSQAASNIEKCASHAVARQLNMRLTFAATTAPQRLTAGEIPGRNGLLAMLALSFSAYDYDAIAMGIHAGTPYYDCSPTFANRLDAIIREYSAGRTRFFAPFLNWTKCEIYQYCRMANLDLSMTYSCEAGTLPPCGQCLSCLDRAPLDACQNAESVTEKRVCDPNAAAPAVLFEQGSSERKRS
jgi:7-cyano-7-deazaguanine synthase